VVWALFHAKQAALAVLVVNLRITVFIDGDGILRAEGAAYRGTSVAAIVVYDRSQGTPQAGGILEAGGCGMNGGR